MNSVKYYTQDIGRLFGRVIGVYIMGYTFIECAMGESDVYSSTEERGLCAGYIISSVFDTTLG